MMLIDGKVVDESTIEIIDIMRDDYPDFSDAYIYSAKFNDGDDLTGPQLDKLNGFYYESINAIIHDRQLYL